MKRMTTEEIAPRFAQAKEAVARGAFIKAACKDAGITYSAYFSHLKKAPAKPVKRKASPRLSVVDLPEAAPTQGLFMVFGSPAKLAEFARGMQ